MKKETVLTLVACALFGAAAVCDVWAQAGSAAPAGAAPGSAAPGGPGAARGGFGRGFGRGQFSPPGLPAPVPAEVTMPRPTLEEVAKINTELQQFINTNRIIAKLDDHKHVFFMNINSMFFDDKGGLIGFRPADNLHPVEQGYEIWASAVAPTLRSWVK